MQTHILTYSNKEEIFEGSHGRESTTYYNVVECSCGFEGETLSTSDGDETMRLKVLSHKVEVLLKNAGIKFSEVKV